MVTDPEDRDVEKELLRIAHCARQVAEERERRTRAVLLARLSRSHQGIDGLSESHIQEAARRALRDVPTATVVHGEQERRSVMPGVSVLVLPVTDGLAIVHQVLRRANAQRIACDEDGLHVLEVLDSEVVGVLARVVAHVNTALLDAQEGRPEWALRLLRRWSSQVG